QRPALAGRRWLRRATRRGTSEQRFTDREEPTGKECDKIRKERGERYDIGNKGEGRGERYAPFMESTAPLPAAVGRRPLVRRLRRGTGVAYRYRAGDHAGGRADDGRGASKRRDPAHGDRQQ